MLTEKAKKSLDEIIKLANKKEGKITSTTFYDAYIHADYHDDDTNTMLDMQEYLTGNNVLIVVDETDTEDESDFSPTVERIVPYDSTKINIVMEPLAVGSLLERLEDDEYMGIDLNTSFQRRAGLWSQEKKSRLIESFLLKIPLPAFYFDTSNEARWLVIDGLQRISAIKEFMVDKTLVLSGMEFFTDLNGLRFDELPKQLARRIKENSIVTYRVKSGTPINVKYYIFKRLNTGGLELKPQEIRHALYQGKATTILEKLASSEIFVTTTCHSISTDRMLDQEFVLRFYAVCYYGIDKYQGLPEEFLNDAMNSLNKCVPEDMIVEFENVLSIIWKIFERNSFRKIGLSGNRRQINKALFECWCKCIFDLNPIQRKHIILSKNRINKRFINLCQEDKFLLSLKGSDKISYKNRFTIINTIVEDLFYDY